MRKSAGSLATLCCSTHCTENSKQIFSEMKLRGLIPNFYIQISEQFIYSHNRSAFFAVLRLRTDRGNTYINCSQKHECRNWERGRAFSFLGICVSNFRYSAFAVHECRVQLAVTGKDKIWGLHELSTYAGLLLTPPPPPIASTGWPSLLIQPYLLSCLNPRIQLPKFIVTVTLQYIALLLSN
jgi:hypothetical protein